MSASFAILSSLFVGGLVLTVLWKYLPLKRDRWLGLLGLFMLFGVTMLLGLSGVLSNFSQQPPRFILFLAGLLISSGLVSLSPWGFHVVQSVPLRTLIALQGFRILPETLLDLAWRDGLAPIQMTFHGWNGDIMTAITAIALAIFWNKLPKPSAWAWAHGVLGLILLTNIVGIAVLSSPTAFRLFMNEPANTFVTQFPYIWLPGIHVFVALTLHILSLRKLLQRN